MNMRAIVGWALLLIIASDQRLMAQALPDGIEVPADASEVIVIWPDAPPGTEVTGRPEQISTLPASPALRVVRNVEIPTLTVFLPDSESATRAAVIVAPGGGNLFLVIDYGYWVARWLRDRGVAAFVLRYRVRPTGRDESSFTRDIQQQAEEIKHLFSMTRDELEAQRWDARWEAAFQDGMQAIRVVRSQASRWRIDPTKIGILGESAGGFIVNAAASQYDKKSRPDFAISISAGSVRPIDVPADAPPLFIAAATDDDLVNHAFDVVKLYTSWREAGRPAEFHAYEKGGHGTMTQKVLAHALGEWMAARGLVTNAR